MRKKYILNKISLPIYYNNCLNMLKNNQFLIQ